MEKYINDAIMRMVPPKDKNRFSPIDITNKCDLHCSNCTRLLKNQTEFWDMTVENFREALRSLRGYTGTILMIGGNPCMHKHFTELCEIFIEEVPDKNQRGLFTNNVFDYHDIVVETFGFINYNPHGDIRCTESMEKLKLLKQPADFYGLYYGNSYHTPLLTAVKDLYDDKEVMWDDISKCDINREWCTSIIQNKGQLRAYFCEVAASFDLARGEAHGLPVTDGWYKSDITNFVDQVKHFCPGCGAPAKLTGNLDIDQIDTYTKSNADLAENSLKKHRKIIMIKDISDIGVQPHRSDRGMVNYNDTGVVGLHNGKELKND